MVHVHQCRPILNVLVQIALFTCGEARTLDPVYPFMNKNGYELALPPDSFIMYLHIGPTSSMHFLDAPFQEE